MRIKSRYLVLGTLAVCILALGLWAYGLHSRAARAVAAYKQELRAAGEKLTVDELSPRRLSREENSAGLFKQNGLSRNGPRTLLDTNGPTTMRMVAPGKAMVGWAQTAIRDRSTNTWEEEEAVLAQDQRALDLIGEVIARPGLDFQLDYRKGFTLLLPHLAPLRQTAVRLSQAAVCDLHYGRSDLAARKIRIMLAMVKGMTDERLVISQLVRMAIAQNAVAASWELLQSPNCNEEQLAVIQDEWTGLEFSQAVENGLLMERAMTEATMEEMRSSSDAFRSVASGWSGSRPMTGSGNWFEQAAELTVLKTKETVWNYSWSYPDQLKSLKGHQAIIEATRQFKDGRPFKSVFQEELKRLKELGIKVAPADSEWMPFNLNDMGLRSLFSDSVMSLESLLRRVVTVEASRRMAVTAIALKRYELRHGRYPPDLAGLVPEYLPAIPRDPVDRESLHYHLNPDGTFMLYSIGDDGEDNGGDGFSVKGEAFPTKEFKSFSWLQGRDLVWPQPATPAEVEDYYQKLSTRRGQVVGAALSRQNMTNGATEGGKAK